MLPRGPAYTHGGVRRRGYFTEREVTIAVTRVLRDDPSKVNETQSRKITVNDFRQTFSNPRLYMVRRRDRLSADRAALRCIVLWRADSLPIRHVRIH